MLVHGKNVALEYLNSSKKINAAYLSENFNDNEIINLLKKYNIKISYLKKYQMNQKFPKVNQGIVLDIEDFKYQDLSILNDASFIVMLDHIEDPHNFGAIIRTCEAASVDGIIIPNKRSVSVNDTVVKTSVGTVEKVNIVQVSNLVNTIKTLKKEGFWIVGTDMNGTDYTKIDYSGKICIICGNEGSGLSDLVKKNCDFIASIPMTGTVNSLNASVATGIILFEALEKRGE